MTGSAPDSPERGLPPDRQDDRVVPVYAVTGGRTRSTGRDLPLESLVSATDQATRGADLPPEHQMIIDLAAGPMSLAEIGAHLQVPIGVARVLVTDLADSGHLVVHAPHPTAADGGPSAEVLSRLLEGLRAR